MGAQGVRAPQDGTTWVDRRGTRHHITDDDSLGRRGAWRTKAYAWCERESLYHYSDVRETTRIPSHGSKARLAWRTTLREDPSARRVGAKIGRIDPVRMRVLLATGSTLRAALVCEGVGI